MLIFQNTLIDKLLFINSLPWLNCLSSIHSALWYIIIQENNNLKNFFCNYLLKSQEKSNF